MIDHEAALRFDAALDRFVRGEHASEDSLMNTARAMHQIDASQRSVPSDAFRARLRETLVGDGPVEHLNGHHPVTEGNIPVPLPERPVQLRSSHRWLAIAAALLLLLAGGGAILLEGVGLRNDSEPSAIPAVSFASPEVKEHATGSLGATNTATSLAPLVPMALSDGTLYRIEHEMGDAKFTGLRAYRTKDSKRLWDVASSDFGNLLVAAGDTVFTTLKPNGSDAGQIVAYDAGSGDVVWTMPSSGTVTGLAESDGALYAVNSTGSVAAIDMEAGTLRWSSQVDGGAETPPSTFGSPVGVARDYVAVLTPAGTVAVLHRADGAIAWTRDGYDPAATGFALTDDGMVIFSRRERVIDPSQPVATPDAFAVVMTPVGGQPTNGPEATAPAEPWVDVSWEVVGYDLASGGFYWSGGGQVVNAPPVALNGVVAYSGTTYDRGPNNRGLVDGIMGNTPRQPGTVILDLPAQHKDETWTQLGTWTPPDGSPPVFVAVSSDGLLTLISPRRLGPVEGLSNENDPYDGAFVELGQPVISQPIGDESGIWVTLADGTLASIHPQRLMRSATPPSGTPTTPEAPANTSWIAPGPDETKNLGEDGNAHVFDDGRSIRVFSLGSGAYVVQAIDARTGDALWETEIDSSGTFMMTSGDVLLVAGKDDKGDGHLVALDTATGQQLWTADLSDAPEGMTMAETRALVLGSSDTLDAIDIETGHVAYAVDIHGDAQHVGPTVSRDRYIVEHRVALDGETLYATLADGSVVAVEWETGAVEWQSVRLTPGQVQIYVVDGAIVTVDQGDLRKVQTGYITKSLAERTATPDAATPAPATFSFSCNASDSSASPVATPSTTGTGGTVNATYRGLDRETGDVLWTNSIPGVSAGQLDVDSGILTIQFGLIEGSSEPPEITYCLVDTEVGQISAFDPLDAISIPILRIESSSRSAKDWPLGFLIDRYFLPFPSEYAEGITGAVVVFGPSVEDALKDGWFWREVYENRIYYSTTDGALVSIPIPNQ